MADNGSENPFDAHDIKQNSGVSASMALQAMQKAWDLRQAAHAAGDPNAREEILAKAINKEIEAESFGKAAKYTQSGAFQGLAAGAGLGVQPGVTLGKITGAIVGGLVATVTGLLGGGIGSVYGAMVGPMWNLGEMASHGVRGVVGDFPNWKSTPAQKKALEKMVMQSKETQAPSKEELEKMKAEAPDKMPKSWSQTTNDMTSWRPSMPSMPNMPNMPDVSKAGAALGLGGLGASMPSWGGQTQVQQQPTQAQGPQAEKPFVQASQQKPAAPQEPRMPKKAPTPKEAPKSKEATKANSTPASKPDQPSKPKQMSTPQKTNSSTDPGVPQSVKQVPKGSSEPSRKTAPKLASRSSSTMKPSPTTPESTPTTDNKENKPPAVADVEKRKPRKLAPKGGDDAASGQSAAAKRAPRKLESRKAAS